MSFMSFAAEASAVLPDSAYHARVAREAADRGGYSFNAAAFPQLFDLDACSKATIDLSQLTPLSLNQQAQPTASAARRHDDSCSSSSAARVAPPAAATSSHVSSSPSGLELTMHESHAGNLIGSVVWEGGRVLAWVLETMHDRVRELKPDGSGFSEQAEAARSASSFTSPAYSEYLLAQSSGACFDLPRNFLVGARVLELGAGTGITGLACAKLGAAQVVLTDIAELLPLMAENVRRNCPGTLRDNEAWRPTVRQRAEVLVEPVAAAPAASCAAASAPSAAVSSSAASSIAPSFPEYESCSNCDDLTIGLLRCSVCDVALCDLCDASWHRPANKSSHQRIIGGIFAEGATSSPSAAVASASSAAAVCSSSSAVALAAAACMQPVEAASASSGASALRAAASSSSAAVTPAAPIVAAAPSSAAAPSYVLPSHCDVYVEELLWGEHSSLSSLPLCLRAPFDVIVLADVVYDAWATVGPGSEDCDTFRRLFATLCLLVPEGSSTTVLLTYTPRRAPERAFFELLATAFLWCVYPATSLLPAHEPGSVDERIWIYHLHRSRMAGRVKQQAYIHASAYGSAGAQIDAERERRRERERRQRKDAEASPPLPMYVSASAIPAAPPAALRRPDSPDAVEDAAAASASAAAAAAPVNITPTLTRYLESEEERQQAQLRAKLERRATRHTIAAQLASARGAVLPQQTDAAHL